jgi:hypothetical protein
MTSFFKEIVRFEPHSIDEIRVSLDKNLADHKQFIPLLKEHHDYLQESISVLIGVDTTDFQKQEHLERFFRLLEMHGKAEQEVLYNHLKANDSREARLEGFGGQDEHDLAFQLEEELLKTDYKNKWNEEIEAKAKVLAVLVKNHLKEEEDTMFTIATSHMTVEELEDMRDSYIQKCVGYLINNRAEEIYSGTWNKDNFSDKSTDIIHH